MSKLLSKRDAQLKQARQSAAESEKLANDAMQRAKRVAKLLDDREKQLDQMAKALKSRDAVLAKELKRASQREKEARRAGRKAEMTAAAQLRGRLERDRVVLKRELGAQQKALAETRAEAKSNSEARVAAEKEAATLRAEQQTEPGDRRAQEAWRREGASHLESEAP